MHNDPYASISLQTLLPVVIVIPKFWKGLPDPVVPLTHMEDIGDSCWTND